MLAIAALVDRRTPIVEWVNVIPPALSAAALAGAVPFFGLSTGMMALGIR